MTGLSPESWRSSCFRSPGAGPNRLSFYGMEPMASASAGVVGERDVPDPDCDAHETTVHLNPFYPCSRWASR
jgi:hypothetical protein